VCWVCGVTWWRMTVIESRHWWLNNIVRGIAKWSSYDCLMTEIFCSKLTPTCLKCWLDVFVFFVIISACASSAWLMSVVSYITLYAYYTFLLAKAATAFSASQPSQFCPSVRPFVRLSHWWISQKRRKIGSPNLHRRLPRRSSFKNRKAFP